MLAYSRNPTVAHSVPCVWQRRGRSYMVCIVFAACGAWIYSLVWGPSCHWHSLNDQLYQTFNFWLEIFLDSHCSSQMDTCFCTKLIKTGDIWTNYDVMTGEPDPIACLLQRNSSLDSLMFLLVSSYRWTCLDQTSCVPHAEDRPFVGALKVEADGLATIERSKGRRLGGKFSF